MAQTMVADLKLEKVYKVAGKEYRVQAMAKAWGLLYPAGYWQPEDFEIDSIELTFMKVFQNNKEVNDFPKELKEEVHNDFFEMAEKADFNYFDYDEADKDEYLNYLEEEELARKNIATQSLEEMVKNSKLLKAIYG